MAALVRTGNIACSGKMTAAAPADGAAASACRVAYSSCLHDGTRHGYALADRNIYDKQATERDWERIFAMFHRQISPVFT